MNSTAKALWDYFDGKGELTPPIIADLFGGNYEDRNLLYGLYKGLYIMDVTWKEVYRCYLTNNLDKLIHTKYSIYPSGYYERFCNNNITIGQTYYNLKSTGRGEQ